MKMQMRHRLPGCHAAGVKQIHARCAQNLLVMQRNFLDDGKDRGHNIRWRAEEINMVGFGGDHGVPESLNFKRQKAQDVFILINHPRGQFAANQLANDAGLHDVVIRWSNSFQPGC